jgi:MFS family permease
VVTFIGASHDDSLWIAGLTSVVCVVFSIIPVLFVDKVGRRIFMWLGAALQSACFIVVAALFGTVKPNSHNKTHGIVTLTFIFIFYVINCSTWFGITWVYPGEIMPLRVRERGMGLAVIFYWLFQYMFVLITPIALTNIGYKFYIILAVFNAVIAVIVFVYFPETKGKSLEELDYFFAKRYLSPEKFAQVEEELSRTLRGQDEKKSEAILVEHTEV